MKKTLISLAAIGALTATTPAFADNIAIEYRDLNLSTVEGQEALERRIDRAAREVCGIDDSMTGTRIRSSRSRECFAKVKKQASQQIAAILNEERLGG